MVVGILVILVLFVTMVYGPIAAMLVELFPTRIRYTSMSLPYHIGNGWFGGMLPSITFAMVAQNGNIYYGLWYPIGVAAMSFVIGMLFVSETRTWTSTPATERRVTHKPVSAWLTGRRRGRPSAGLFHACFQAGGSLAGLCFRCIRFGYKHTACSLRLTPPHDHCGAPCRLRRLRRPGHLHADEGGANVDMSGEKHDVTAPAHGRPAPQRLPPRRLGLLPRRLLRPRSKPVGGLRRLGRSEPVRYGATGAA